MQVYASPLSLSSDPVLGLREKLIESVTFMIPGGGVTGIVLKDVMIGQETGNLSHLFKKWYIHSSKDKWLPVFRS